MEFFLDSANIEEIKDVAELGFLAGVTTNPSLIAKEKKDLKEVLKEVANIVKGSISAEVLSKNAQDMVEEGKELFAIAKNITIKVPMTKEGLKAVTIFSRLNITTNVTLVFSVNQALLAARSGATYISPFLGRLDDIGHNGMELVSQIAKVFSLHNIATKIIAASIRNPLHVSYAALYGADIATIPYAVFKQLLEHPLTDIGIKKFEDDWFKV